VAVLLLLSHALSVLAQCPDVPPRDAIQLVLSCGTRDACPNGPLLLKLHPIITGIAELETDWGYSIQSCDTVTWDFGDGTTEVLTGSSEVTHDYPVTGNYTITVTIANTLGSITKVVGRSVPIADSPSRLSFMTAPPPAPYTCSNCVFARENEGAVTIRVRRTLDLSRTITVVANVPGYTNIPTVSTFAQMLTFAPNETEKTFTVPLQDDSLYFGPRFHALYFTDFTGGAFWNPLPFVPHLMMVDDEPAPVWSIEPAGVSVIEGHSGRTPVSIPVHLSEPMARDVVALVFFDEGSASYNDFDAGGGVWIKAGETSGVVRGWVISDTNLESDETFTVRIAEQSPGGPTFGNTTATVTIINDDSHGPPHEAIPALGPFSMAALAIGLAALALFALKT
jgi:PKD repeat protein